MQGRIVDGYELGQEQGIEADVAAALSKLPEFRRPKNIPVLAYWAGQIVGWPGYGFFSAERSLADQQEYVAGLISDLKSTAAAISQALGDRGDEDVFWAMLCDGMGTEGAAARRAYVERLAPALPWLAEAPRFRKRVAPSHGGRPEQDLFAKVVVRVVCAYLIYVERLQPQLQHPDPAQGKCAELAVVEETAPSASAGKPRLSVQHAGTLAQVVLDVLGVRRNSRLETLVHAVRQERWARAGEAFSFWNLLPDVAPPAND